MPSRNQKTWEQPPELPGTHYVSGDIYRNQKLYEQEQETIFSKVWRFACHESELPTRYDFRTVDHAGVPLLLIRGRDDKIRTFVNACAHRGAKLINDVSGNARTLRCFFHHWTYDTNGECIAIPRASGYSSSGLRKDDCGLREVKSAVKLGLVFFNLDDRCSSLNEYLGNALETFEEVLSTGNLQVFHYHQAVIEANWKASVESNMDPYHEAMHVVLRKTNVMTEESMKKRLIKLYPNGHVSLGGMEVDYSAMKVVKPRDGSGALPGLVPDAFQSIPLFPNTVLMTRGTVMRIDTTTPLGVDKCLVEWRGLGVKGESREERLKRIDQHNEFWGPFAHNLPEDLYAAEACGYGFRERGAHYGIMAREENLSAQDDGIMRAFYAEWSRRMGRPANRPV